MSEKNPVEKTFQSYSHDYPDDTTLEFTRTDRHSELVLTFRSEDPDMGKEEMIYGSDRSEPMADLIADLKNDLTSYLDAQDTSSFYQQQKGLGPDEIQSEEDYLGEYSRTALYAFEAILEHAEQELQGVSVQSPVNEEKPVHPQETHQAEIPQVNTSTSVIPMGLLMPDCGEVITKQDLLDHGYPYDGLLPITKEKAYALFDQGAELYALYPNDGAYQVVNHAEITAHVGYFGIDQQEWRKTPDYQQRLAVHDTETAQLEQLFLTKAAEPSILIYQLRDGEELRDYYFASTEELEKRSLAVERRHYEPLYTMTFPTTETKPERLLEDFFYMFNMRRPGDFRGHSMSISDIIAIKLNGEVSFHYVDLFGFKRLDGFLRDNPLKNAEMSMEDDYGQIDGIINNGKAPALEEQKKEPPSILAKLSEPLPDRKPRDHAAPKKNKEMER